LPLVGFKCPANGEEPGRDNAYDYCIGSCSKRCMPKSVLCAIRNDHVRSTHTGDMLSPSALKGCARKTVLERTEDYTEEPPKLYYAVRGALIHGFLEKNDAKGVVTEQRVYKKVTLSDGRELVVSGQIDDYDSEEALITDFKTNSDKGTWFLFNEGAKPEHIQQTNIYRWLLAGGHLGSIDGPQVFWPVEKIVIAYLFMNRVVQTGATHYEDVTTYRSPNSGKKYKLEKGRKVIGHSNRGVPIWRIEIEIPAVPLWDTEEVIRVVESGAGDLHKSFEVKKSGSLPPGVLYDSDQAWECGFCGVQKQCFSYEQATNSKKFSLIYPNVGNNDSGN
jgi:hypothetical protein